MTPMLKKSVSLYTILLYCVLGLALMLSVIYFISEQNAFGFLVLASVIILSAATVIGMIAHRRTIQDKIIDDATALAHGEKDYLEHWENAYIIYAPDGRIIWKNAAFTQRFPEADEDIRHLLNMELNELLPQDSASFTWAPTDGVTYAVLASRCELMDKHGELSEILYNMSFDDITHQLAIETENANIRPMVAMIYIDNYDQVMSSVDETTRPLLEAQVYKRLNELTEATKGILTRQEKDRLLLIFPHETLDPWQETRFSILDNVRAIDQGNKMPVTLSIGVGVAPTMEKSHDLAQAAVELALGRGGDQAVVKTVEETTFYGGKSGAVEKTTRVRARIIGHAIRDLIGDAQTVVVMGHTKPDLDCFGAALAMAQAATVLGKETYIMLDSDKPAIQKIYDRAIAEGDYAGRFIKANAVDAVSGDKTLVIVVDVNRPQIVDCPELLEKNAKIVVIDHHRTGIDSIANAAISFVEPSASSTSEMVTELVQYMVDHPILHPIEADALFAGIALDTKHFVTKSGIRTFEAAAYLRRLGADTMRVRQLFKNNIDEYRTRAVIVSQAKGMKGNVAMAKWDGSDHLNNQVIASMAADDMLEIEDIDAAFVLTKVGEQVNISARSSAEFNVQVIMEQLGGGGHSGSAAAQLKETDLEEAEKMLKAVLREYIQTMDVGGEEE